MIQIKRFYTQYDRREDRISLIIERDQSEAVQFWLTHSLLDKLIPYFSGWLEKNFIGNPNCHDLLEYEKTFAQQHLLEADACISELKVSFLFDTVEVRDLGTEYQLIFQVVNNTFFINFSRLALFQWMVMLKNEYEAANWPVSTWPVWILESKVEPKFIH